MSQTLHIFISDDNTGQTILGLRETCPKRGEMASKELQSVLSEPYLISRLLDDANLAEDVRKEMVIYKHPRYKWGGI